MRLDPPTIEPTTDEAEFRADLLGMSRIIPWAVWTNVALGLLLHAAGALPAMRPFGVVAFGLAIQITASVATLWTPTVRRPLAVYFGFHLLDVVWVSAMLWFGGGWSCPGASLFYGLIVINGGSVGGIPAHVLAAASACAYGAMLSLERQLGVLTVAVAPVDQLAAVVMMWVGLHLVAAYTGRLATLLRMRRNRLVMTHRALERQRATLEEQVRRRTDSMRSVIYVLTHDLKNPLNAIHLRAELLLQSTEQKFPPEVRQGLERIGAQAAAAEDKIQALLDLFRVEWQAEPFGWVDLHTLARETVEALRLRLADKAAEIAIRDLPHVWGQRGKLFRVLFNLLENGINHVPRGGGVISVDAITDDRHATVRVRDNGVGIPARYQATIFEVFRRVPEAEQLVDGDPVPGTGVGLALVKQVVEQHGGTISVHSVVGEGTCFAIRLPMTPIAEAA